VPRKNFETGDQVIKLMARKHVAVNPHDRDASYRTAGGLGDSPQGSPTSRSRLVPPWVDLSNVGIAEQ